MKLLKNIFSVFLIVAFATTHVFAAENCDNNKYRKLHPSECNYSKQYNTFLALVGGAVLVGVGVALASQTSDAGHSSATTPTNQNGFQHIVLSGNINTNYNQNDTVQNRRISTLYPDSLPSGDDIGLSTINQIKSTGKYQRNRKQYDEINYAWASARGFSGKNTNIIVIDDFYSNHGNTVHDIVKYIVPGANITNNDIATSANTFNSFDYIANTISTSDQSVIYNASWQISASDSLNAATAIYNKDSAKTYADAQQYMYNITSENFITQMRNSAIDNDAIFVWAAGNEGNSESGALSAMPLAFPDLMGHFVNVVALDNYENIAWYSNQCGVTQNYCIATPGSGWNTDTQSYASGTSFAAPVVSGAIAIIKEAFPYMNASQITQLLFTTATDLGETGVDAVYGWGLLDMERATKPVGTPRIFLSEHNIQPLNTINVSGAAAASIKNANIKIAFMDDFGRAFTTNLSDNVNVIPYGRGFDKLRESKNDSFVLFDSFEFGFKQNNLLESYGLMSVQSNKLTNFIGYKNEFGIENVRFYQNVRVGMTTPTTDNDSIISGFSNIYTSSLKMGAEYSDLSFEIAIPDTIISGNMFLNMPVGKTNDGQIVYNNTNIDLSNRPSIEYTAKYKMLSATFVENPDYENEFFIMAKTKLAF